METIKNERIVFFDVDGTLVDTQCYIDVTGEIQYRSIRKHVNHVDQIIRHHNRGFHVIVWSANGYEWAQKVVEDLGLQPYVNQIMSKPNAYFDDKDANEWMKRVFIDD